jgi:hypothetical protein
MMPQVGASLLSCQNVPRVVNYAPREHIYYWLYIQYSRMIIIYNCKTFIVQATGAMFGFRVGKK